MKWWLFEVSPRVFCPGEFHTICPTQFMDLTYPSAPPSVHYQMHLFFFINYLQFVLMVAWWDV